MYKALDVSFDRDQADFHLNCNLVFLSARPHIYKDLAEEHSYRLFTSLVLENRLHTFPTLIPGTLWNSLRGAICQPCLGTRAWKYAGEGKFQAFSQFRRLHGEYDFVFLGDNGQGDLLAGQMMVDDEELALTSDDDTLTPHSSRTLISSSYSSIPEPETRSQVRAVLIREVLPDFNKALTVEHVEDRQDEGVWKKDYEEKGLFFHKTYVGAALKLHKHIPDVITVEKLRDIVAGAVESCRYGFHMYPGWKWKDATRNLKADIDEANKVLRRNGLEVQADLDAEVDKLAEWDAETKKTSAKYLQRRKESSSEGSSSDGMDEV